MDVKTWTFLIVGATFALYIGIAIWSRANTTSDFYIAGRGVHPVVNGMATGADWMSAASFISMAGRCTLMAPTSTRWSASVSPVALAAMSPTSIYTKHFVSLMVAVDRVSAPSVLENT